MVSHKVSLILLLFIFLTACEDAKPKVAEPAQNAALEWNNATIYFLLTDRFSNGDSANDFKVSEGKEAAAFRGFMGGDLQGVTEKIKEGYFNELGVDAIWTTPVVENITGSVDEGTGRSYGFHGYWTRDWTKIDPRIGGEVAFREFVKAAHEKGIKVIVDVVLNHTGPVTEDDAVWPADWVRTSPTCSYTDAATTIECTLVKNLPDILTENDSTEVVLPEFLINKWKAEGRYDQEMAELDAFFAETGYAKSPQNYIIKWLTDFIRKYGVDGFRVDTAKHVEASVWKKLWDQAVAAFDRFKKEHPEEQYDGSPFYMVGEVYNYAVGGGQWYDYGDTKVNFFDNGFNSLINFGFKYDANQSPKDMHELYDSLLHNQLEGKYILNYLSSHDDGGPWDKERTKTFEAANRLLLSQGGAQIYYGDESGRSLSVPAEGDAVLRGFMNWEEMKQDSVNNLVDHWKKLGQFRHAHPAVGAGQHKTLSEMPYVFARTHSASNDQVVIGLGLEPGMKKLAIGEFAENGSRWRDYYSGNTGVVNQGFIEIESPHNIVLLAK